MASKNTIELFEQSSIKLIQEDKSIVTSIAGTTRDSVDSYMKIRNSILASNSKISVNKQNDKKVFLLGEGTVISL